MKENTLAVTKYFSQDVGDIFGKITFNTDSEAYKQLLKNPGKYMFVLSYVERDDPKEDPFLFELSMVRRPRSRNEDISN